jgi:predicted enzyme related to lactoylglutathione lyase
MSQTITWFEIRVTDIERAQRFYEAVLGRALRRESFGGGEIAIFPSDPPASGAVCSRARMPAPRRATASASTSTACRAWTRRWPGSNRLAAV